MTNLQTVVELPEFLRRAKAIMPDDERAALVNYIAANPEAGVSLGGGLRKVRIAREGGGRRWLPDHPCFRGVAMPIFLVTVFAKNEKDNLSRAEQAELIALGKLLLAHYGDRS
jgi:hypothetical protein